MLRNDLLTLGVTGAVFKIAGEMHRMLAYFDNPASKLINMTTGTLLGWTNNVTR